VPKRSQGVRQFLAGKQIPTLEHIPHSPDLAPRDIFLFPKLERSLKEPIFSQSTEDIHKKMAELLKSFSQNDFRRCWKAWKAHVGQCVASDGNYFEGNNV
jgi:hypothetical protein